MLNNLNYRTLLVSVFIAICMVVIALSSAYVFKTMFAFTLAGAMICGAGVLIVLFLLHTQRVLVREVIQLKYSIDESDEIEENLRSQIGSLASRVRNLTPSTRDESVKAVNRLNKVVTKLDQELNEVSDRITQIEEYGRGFEPTDGNIIPLHGFAGQTVPDSGTGAANQQNLTEPFTNKDNQTDSKNDGSFHLLSETKNKILAEKLRKAVRLNQLELNLQPVVSLASRKPVFYETTLRLLESTELLADQNRLLQCAEEEKLASALDSQVLFGSVQLLRTLDELGKKTGLLCPISYSTLRSDNSFSDVHSFLRDNVALASTLILEIDQSALHSLIATGRNNLNRIADLGFPLLLNNVQHFDLDSSLLRNLGFRYLKISMNELLSISTEGNIDEKIMDFSAELEQSGISVIVSDVETETQAIHLINFDLAYGQGSLFAIPRPVKPELFRPVENKRLFENIG